MNNYSHLRVGVVGATGYAGIELIRLLRRHPGVELVAAMSSGRNPQISLLSELAPGLAGIADLPVVPGSVQTALEAGVEAVFLATPHEASMDWVAGLLEARTVSGKPVLIVDLSGAFRFQQQDVFEKWYKLNHTVPHLLPRAVYGWPERYRDEIRTAQLVGNPGCYATAAMTAIWPLAAAGLIEADTVICDAKSGASGAGKGLRDDLHFVELEGNCKAYGVLSHRHTPEIAQQSGIPVEQLIFTPHLLPTTRGILTTTYVRLKPGVDETAVEAAYRTAYDGHPFTRFRGAQLPELNHVAHTNFCDVGFRINQASRQAVVVSCLDNLLKGAAGQALQNFNLMTGWPEDTALL